MGIDPEVKKARRRAKALCKRNLNIYEMYLAGQTLHAIGKKHHLTPSAIQYVVKIVRNFMIEDTYNVPCEKGSEQ